MSFILFFAAIIMQCSFFYYFVVKYIPMKLDEEPDEKIKFYSLATLFTILDIMSIWSLLKTYLSNPGYVSDYFTSLKSGSASIVRENTPRTLEEGEDPKPKNTTQMYDVYLKD